MSNPKEQYVFDETSAKTFTITKEYSDFCLFLPYRPSEYKVYSVQLKLKANSTPHLIGFGNMGYDPDGKFYVELVTFYDIPERLDLENGKTLYLAVEWTNEQLKAKIPILYATLYDQKFQVNRESEYLLEIPIYLSDTNLNKEGSYAKYTDSP